MLLMLLTVLIGLLAGRRRWAQRIPELMPQIRRIAQWLLVMGLGCGAAFTIIFELPCARAVARQAAGQLVLRLQQAGDDAVLRNGHLSGKYPSALP